MRLKQLALTNISSTACFLFEETFTCCLSWWFWNNSPAQQSPNATPVNIRRMLPFLSGYNHSLVQILESVLHQVFMAVVVLKTSLFWFRLCKIQKHCTELDAHRLASLFSSPHFSVFRRSPLGLVPKKVLIAELQRSPILKKKLVTHQAEKIWLWRQRTSNLTPSVQTLGTLSRGVSR